MFLLEVHPEDKSRNKNKANDEQNNASDGLDVRRVGREQPITLSASNSRTESPAEHTHART